MCHGAFLVIEIWSGTCMPGRWPHMYADANSMVPCCRRQCESVMWKMSVEFQWIEFKFKYFLELQQFCLHLICIIGGPVISRTLWAVWIVELCLLPMVCRPRASTPVQRHDWLRAYSSLPWRLLSGSRVQLFGDGELQGEPCLSASAMYVIDELIWQTHTQTYMYGRLRRFQAV